MGLFGKNNKNPLLKAQPTKYRVETVTVPKPAPKPASAKPIRPLANGSSARSTPRPSPKPPSIRQKSNSPYPSSSDETRLARKRKAGSAGAAPRRSPVERVTFDKDSDGEEDDGWLTLEARKRQRKTIVGGRKEDANRKMRYRKAFEDGQHRLEFIHATGVASLDCNCVPAMGAEPRKEEVDFEIQYPSLAPRERFQLVQGKDKIDAVDATERIVQYVAESYLTPEEAEPFTNQTSGIIRKLQKASNRNIQDVSGFKKAIQEYNTTLLQLVEDGVVAKNLDNLHELPRHLVNFILDQIYDRTVAPKVELLSKYENGTDYVYGELLHPFISKIFLDECNMTSKQVMVDLGSGVGNVVLQTALEVGCESYGCEMMENACNLAEAQVKEFDARCVLWGIKPGKVRLERGDFRKNTVIQDALKRADVVLVNNKAFTSQLNNDLSHMFLDLKTGCRVVSLKSFVTDSSYNVNDVARSIFDVEEKTYPEDYVSWTHAGGSYFISTKKVRDI